MVGWSRVPRSGKASAWSELSRGARTAGDGRDQRTASFAFGALWEGFGPDSVWTTRAALGSTPAAWRRANNVTRSKAEIGGSQLTRLRNEDTES